MLEHDGEQRRRPPPVMIPARSRPSTLSVHSTESHSRASEGQSRRQPGWQQRDTPSDGSPSKQSYRNTVSSRASSVEQDNSRASRAESQHQKRADGLKKLAELMEQAGATPRRSRTSDITQASTDTFNQDTRSVRGRIESKNEQHLFSTAGRVLPTQTGIASVNDELQIEVHDLRGKSRTASEESPPKSPKKKFMGMSLPEFTMPPALRHPASRKPGSAKKPQMPQMPEKFAEIVGEKPRSFRQIPVRPIKPSGYMLSPTRAPRSDTSKSLPAKIRNQDEYARRHHASTTRRSRGGIRKSPPRRGPQSSDAENVPPEFAALNKSFESKSPPTPPAKDTPPDMKAPGSPLRRTAPSESLRESYGNPSEQLSKLRFPVFALSPTSQTGSRESAGMSPTKPVPGTVEDYQRLVAGLPQPFPFDKQACGEGLRERYYQASSASEKSAQVSPTDFDGKSLKAQYNTPSTGRTWPEAQHAHYEIATLEARYYQPQDGLTRTSAESGECFKEAAPQPTSIERPSTDPLNRSDESHNESINMIFQGDVNDIDPSSSTGRLLQDQEPGPSEPKPRQAAIPKPRVIQELQFGEQEPRLRLNTGTNQLQPDQSSSNLTDMFHGFSPLRSVSNNDFNYPSAVPSPLHKVQAANMPSQPVLPPQNPPGPWELPLTPQAVDREFFRINEHLDVVGKSTWDMIDALKQEQYSTISDKHKQLVTVFEQHVGEVKMQLDSVNEKTDRATEQAHNIHTKLDEVFGFVQRDVMGQLAVQEKKTETLEKSMQELVQITQKTLKIMEQKLCEPKSEQQHVNAAALGASNAAPLPFPLPMHRSQPSLVGYYNPPIETAREHHPPMPHVQDHRDSGSVQDGRIDARAGYGGAYGQQWGPRSVYNGRNNKEDRPYSGAGPYHFGNGNGQFNNGYNGGYSSYKMPPSTPEQH